MPAMPEARSDPKALDSAGCRTTTPGEFWRGRNARSTAALPTQRLGARDRSRRGSAQRIRDRAMRRGGELLTAVKGAKNQHDARAREASGPSTRKAAADGAGLSERQRKEMVRVARVDRDQFESMVGRPKPATSFERVELIAESFHKVAEAFRVARIPRDSAAFYVKANVTVWAMEVAEQSLPIFGEKNEETHVPVEHVPERAGSARIVALEQRAAVMKDPISLQIRLDVLFPPLHALVGVRRGGDTGRRIGKQRCYVYRLLLSRRGCERREDQQHYE